MLSSTSSFERPVPQNAWGRVLAVALGLCLVLTVGWEILWRMRGFEPALQNTNGLWAKTRRRVDIEGDRAVVIVGSSRVMFDLDLQVLSRELGAPLPIQLALEGTSPRPFLHDLAEDPDFSGFVIVGVTPGLFFSPRTGFRADALEHYRHQTPSERISQELSQGLEHVLAFLDPDTRLFTRLERLAWPVRDGMSPPVQEPRRLAVFDEHREADMWTRVEDDPAYRKIARDIWLGLLALPRPPASDEDIADIIGQVQADVSAIVARGGQVVFVRMPSKGPFREHERKNRPRTRAWDRLLQRTQVPGVHFEDHPSLQGFRLPEWSHLSAAEKPAFTEALATQLRPVYQRWRRRAAAR